ncbi:MAG: hypothetical protein QME51_11565, partial [Planctomycetota bacterium]|nr:hypothetical protein [Planctomycetota bacterium]
MKTAIIKLGSIGLFFLLFIATTFAQETEDIIVSEANYKIAVKDNEAQVNLTLNVTHYQDKISQITLCPLNIPVTGSKIPKDVLLISDSKSYKLLFSKSGSFQIEISFAIPLFADNKIQQILFPLVNATLPKIEIKIPQTNLGIMTVPESLYSKRESAGYTILNITPADTSGEFMVLWGPAEIMKKPLEGAGVEITSRYNVDEHSINSSHHLKFSTLSQLIKSFQVKLPLDTIVARVESPNLDRWFVEKGILNIYLRQFPLNPAKAMGGMGVVISLEQTHSLLDKPIVLTSLQTDFGVNKGRIDIITPSDMILDIRRLQGFSKIDAPVSLRSKNTISY